LWGGLQPDSPSPGFATDWLKRKNLPVLYSIYVNDIPMTHKTFLGMYADDTAILAKNKNPKYTAVAQHLEKLDDWFEKWKIALNVSKTEAFYFTKDEKKRIPVIKINSGLSKLYI
ncbi:hypothetical protein AVEN_264283-1, partial [Araneus ventricosus]